MRADADPAREELARAARARLRERLAAEAAELGDDAVAAAVRAFMTQLAAAAPDTAETASGQ